MRLFDMPLQVRQPQGASQLRLLWRDDRRFEDCVLGLHHTAETLRPEGSEGVKLPPLLGIAVEHAHHRLPIGLRSRDLAAISAHERCAAAGPPHTR